jgi:hypothetical protein
LIEHAMRPDPHGPNTPHTPHNEDVQAELDRLGLDVPATDLPFLQRTLLRQRELLRQLSRIVPADTEAAHVFKVQAEAVRSQA